MNSPFIGTIVFIFILGLIVGAIIKMFLYYSHRKQMDKFSEKLEERLAYLSSQMSSQVVDLQESMDVINNEYARLMNKIAKEDYRKGGLTKLTVDSLRKEAPPLPNIPPDIQSNPQSQAPIPPTDEG